MTPSGREGGEVGENQKKDGAQLSRHANAISATTCFGRRPLAHGRFTPRFSKILHGFFLFFTVTRITPNGSAPDTAKTPFLFLGLSFEALVIPRVASSKLKEFDGNFRTYCYFLHKVSFVS